MFLIVWDLKAPEKKIHFDIEPWNVKGIVAIEKKKNDWLVLSYHPFCIQTFLHAFFQPNTHESTSFNCLSVVHFYFQSEFVLISNTKHLRNLIDQNYFVVLIFFFSLLVRLSFATLIIRIHLVNVNRCFFFFVAFINYFFFLLH